MRAVVYDRFGELPELRDVASDQQSRGLQMALTIDRDTASRLGVPLQAIDDVLYDAFGQRQVSIMFTQLNQYRVVLETAPAFQRGPQDLTHVFVRSASGGALQRKYDNRDARSISQIRNT